MMSASSPCSILFCLFWLFVLLCSLLTGVWRNGSDERETYFTAHGTPFFFELLFFFFSFPHLFISFYFLFELSRSYFSVELGTTFAVLRSFIFLFPFSFHTSDFTMLQV